MLDDKIKSPARGAFFFDLMGVKGCYAAFSGITSFWGCVNSLSSPAAAKDYFVRHIIFLISRSEIRKMMCLTKHNSARSAMKTLFTQPHPFGIV